MSPGGGGGGGRAASAGGAPGGMTGAPGGGGNASCDPGAEGTEGNCGSNDRDKAAACASRAPLFGKGGGALAPPWPGSGGGAECHPKEPPLVLYQSGACIEEMIRSTRAGG